MSTRSAVLAGAFAVALALSACGDSGPASDLASDLASGPASGDAAAHDPIAVSSVAVLAEVLVEPITGTGTIAAARTTDIGPSVDGIIEKVFVRVGDRVTKDQELFKTRDVELRLKVEELSARVQLAKAENANAQSNLARLRKLGSSGAASEARRDDAEARAKVAAAQLEVAQAQLAQAEQSLADSLVRAPYDGVVTRRDVDEGRFMVSRFGGGGSMGGPAGVVQIMQIDAVAAIVQVPEIHLPRLALGLPARIEVSGAAEPIEATISALNDRVDSVTRGVEVRIAFANPDYAIKPGSFARAQILPPGRRVLTLPRAAVLGGGASRYVYVAKDGIARRVAIAVREIDAARVEVVEGLDQGDMALSGVNLRRVYDGAPVTVTAAPGAPLAQTSDAP